MKQKNILWILGLITLIGVGIRLYQLTGRSLWFDEAFSWRLIHFPWTEMISRDAADVHPPFYYIILKVWAAVFGSSLLALRSFSVLMGGATIAIAYLFSATAFKSRFAGILSALLIAFSAFQIQYAWEARMYTLGTALFLLSSWLLIKAIRQPRNELFWWLGYALVTTMFAYVHYYSFFSILAQVVFILIFILIQTRGRLGEIIQLTTTRYAALSGVIMALFYSPWIPTFLRQNSQVQQSYWIPKIGGWAVPDTFYRMLFHTASIPNHSGLFWIVVALIPITLICLAWLVAIISRENKQQTKDADWLVAISGIIPFALSITLSLISRSIYQDRFFVFTHLFIIIVLVAVITKIKWDWLKYSIAAVTVVLFIFSSIRYWQEIDLSHKPGAHAAAISIFNQIEEQEPIIVSSPFVYFAIAHYAQEEFNNRVIPRLYQENGELSHFAGGPILTTEDIVGPEVFSSNKKIWVVDTTGFGSGPLNLPEQWHEEQTTSFPEVFGYQGEVSITKYVKKD